MKSHKTRRVGKREHVGVDSYNTTSLAEAARQTKWLNEKPVSGSYIKTPVCYECIHIKKAEESICQNMGSF